MKLLNTVMQWCASAMATRSSSTHDAKWQLEVAPLPKLERPLELLVVERDHLIVAVVDTKSSRAVEQFPSASSLRVLEEALVGGPRFPTTRGTRQSPRTASGHDGCYDRRHRARRPARMLGTGELPRPGSSTEAGEAAAGRVDMEFCAAHCQTRTPHRRFVHAIDAISRLSLRFASIVRRGHGRSSFAAVSSSSAAQFQECATLT